MKKILALALACLLLLSGCSDTKQEQETTENVKTVVTMTAMYSLPTFEKAFEEKCPDIDLQVEVMSTGVINGEIGRRLRKGNGSDLILTSLPAGEIAQYTLDLSAESFVEKYQSTITKSIAIDGENRYLPLPGSFYGYILNKTLLEELGMSMPETTQDLLAILAAAKEAGVGVSGEGYGFGLSDIGAPFLGAYLTADYATDFMATGEGAKWLTALESGTATFTGNWENSVTFIKTCVENGYIDPAKILINYNGTITSDATAFKAEERLPAREAILTYGNIAMFEKIAAATEDEIVMLPCLPETENGYKLFSAVSNNYIALNKALEGDETKRKAALRVLEFLSTNEGQTLWMDDTDCPYTYLTEHEIKEEDIPEDIRSYVENNMVFTNPFPTNLLSYIGKNLSEVVLGKQEIADALTKIDEYYKTGSEEVEYDLSIVGTVSKDMLYVNSNTRTQETEIGNFVSDAIREITGADIALVNGGAIRSSLYKGDVTGSDLSYVCPYGNLVIVCEMDGKTLREAITNGIQKTWKPAGQFLQVSGIKYSFKPAKDETETAELVTLTYADGTEVKDTDTVKVAYTNYMAGSSTYTDAGDGYTMLNVYDSSLPVNVKLVEETGKTFGDILKIYFANHIDDELGAELEGRIEVIG